MKTVLSTQGCFSHSDQCLCSTVSHDNEAEGAQEVGRRHWGQLTPSDQVTMGIFKP